MKLYFKYFRSCCNEEVIYYGLLTIYANFKINIDKLSISTITFNQTNNVKLPGYLYDRIYTKYVQIHGTSAEFINACAENNVKWVNAAIPQIRLQNDRINVITDGL